MADKCSIIKKALFIVFSKGTQENKKEITDITDLIDICLC